MLELPFQRHVLDNGLSVVVHPDPADPLVSVYVHYHVGSAREEPGRTGFAHLFEHMLFQGSAHVPEGAHFREIQEAGGSLNGTTNEDRTNYFETLPSEELELALWLESDRMGWLLPAMTQEKLDNQRDVVKNERRQNYDDRPYGRVREALVAALFPAGHPLSWLPIGSMEDLDRASLADVEAFFRRYYAPSNASLAIGGDVDPDRAVALAERWFGGIPAGTGHPPVAPRPAALGEERRIVLEDRVHVPQLTLAWPTVEAWHPDEPALNLLVDVLSADRASLLDRTLLVDEELATDVFIAHRTLEAGGYLAVQCRPRPGVALGALERRIDELVAEVAAGAADPGRVDRLKARREGLVVRGLDTVAARTGALGVYDCLRGDPAALALDLERHARVRPDEVVAAAGRWLAGRPRVVLSCVPEGRAELAA